MEYEINFDQVVEWIKNKPSGAIIGMPQDIKGCIMYNFLKEKYPYQYFRCDIDGFYAGESCNDNRRYEHGSNQLSLLIRMAVDSHHFDEITREECLLIVWTVQQFHVANNELVTVSTAQIAGFALV